MRILDALAVLVFGRLLPRLPYPVVAGPLRGKRFILGAAAGPAGGVSILAGRCEPEQSAAMAAALAPGHVFFDVGANVGYYTLLAADRVGARGRVVAFEPAVRNLAFLHRHLELNRARNVVVLPFACAGEAGYGFFEGGDTVATGHLVRGGGGSGDAGATAAGGEAPPSAAPVHLVTLDGMVRLLGLRPDVVKIDVEGAEHEVLRGAAETLRTCRPRIFLSIHSDRLRTECLSLLRDHGYDAAPLGGTLASATEYQLTPAR
jgi:FkbM family methyltransferase